MTTGHLTSFLAQVLKNMKIISPNYLAAGAVVPDKILELSSYHAMVACVASGTGIALVPRSVLETVRVRDSIAVYSLPEEHARMTTYLVWRHGEISPALRALHMEILVSYPRRA